MHSNYLHPLAEVYFNIIQFLSFFRKKNHKCWDWFKGMLDTAALDNQVSKLCFRKLAIKMVKSQKFESLICSLQGRFDATKIVPVYLKAAYSVTMNIFRKKLFSF